MRNKHAGVCARAKLLPDPKKEEYSDLRAAAAAGAPLNMGNDLSRKEEDEGGSREMDMLPSAPPISLPPFFKFFFIRPSLKSDIHIPPPSFYEPGRKPTSVACWQRNPISAGRKEEEKCV